MNKLDKLNIISQISENLLKLTLLGRPVVMILIFCTGISVYAQTKCLTPEETRKALLSINQLQFIAENNKLRDELVKMQKARQKVDQNIIDHSEDNQKYVTEAAELAEKHLLRVCEIIRESGWPRKETIGDEGLSSLAFLLENSRPARLQREILPVVSAAAKKGLIGNRPLAYLIDGIRVANGQPQIFGTQTELKDEIFYLYPLQSEKNVDALRKTYGLPPLRDYYIYAQRQLQMPVAKIPRPVQSHDTTENESPNLPTEPTEKEEEIIKVESAAVNLHIALADLGSTNDKSFKKEDFAVYDNGKEQEITYFSFQELPIDLIIMVDYRGWTEKQEILMSNLAQRFVKAARSLDRFAMFSYGGKQRTFTRLTQNRDELFKNVEVADAVGGSGIWSELEFALDELVNRESKNRRSIIIWITDGTDGNLHHRVNPNYTLDNSYNTFTELVEKVRHGETTVIPIYIDTENDRYKEQESFLSSNGYNSEVARRLAYWDEIKPWYIKEFRQARRTMSIIAAESGGRMYYAKKADELAGVYEQVINDLSRVYTLGYESEGKRDGSWHTVEVKLKDQPDIKLTARRGYYAR